MSVREAVAPLERAIEPAPVTVAVAVIVPATAAETRIRAASPIPMNVKIFLLNIVCSLGRCR